MIAPVAKIQLQLKLQSSWPRSLLLLMMLAMLCCRGLLPFGLVKSFVMFLSWCPVTLICCRKCNFWHARWSVAPRHSATVAKKSGDPRIPDDSSIHRCVGWIAFPDARIADPDVVGDGLPMKVKFAVDCLELKLSENLTFMHRHLSIYGSALKLRFNVLFSPSPFSCYT